MDIDTSSFPAIVDQVQRVRVQVGVGQRQNPLKASIGEVVAIGDGRAFIASAGLARTHGCEVVLALPIDQASRTRPLLREFLGRLLSEDLDIGEHFVCEGVRYTSEVMKIEGLGPGLGHSSLDAYLVGMESLAKVIEILPVEDVLDQTELDRSYVLRTVQATWLEGMTRGRLAREGAIWETQSSFAGPARRQTDTDPDWYTTLPGYHVLPGEGAAQSGIGGINLNLFGRDFMVLSTPYAETLGALSIYQELALIGTRQTGERVFTVRAIHLGCRLDEDGLAGLETHDQLWMSTFLRRQGRRLVPAQLVTEHGLWGPLHGQRDRAEAHLLRITGMELSEDCRTGPILRGIVRRLRGRVVEVAGTAPAITTLEARELAGTRLLGPRAPDGERHWIEEAVGQLGGVVAEPADLHFADSGSPRMLCRRHPDVFVIPHQTDMLR